MTFADGAFGKEVDHHDAADAQEAAFDGTLHTIGATISAIANNEAILELLRANPDVELDGEVETTSASLEKLRGNIPNLIDQAVRAKVSALLHEHSAAESSLAPPTSS